MFYCYKWIHLASGKFGLKLTECLTKDIFLDKINRYNYLGQDDWKYVEHNGRIKLTSGDVKIIFNLSGGKLIAEKYDCRNNYSFEEFDNNYCLTVEFMKDYFIKFTQDKCPEYIVEEINYEDLV